MYHLTDNNVKEKIRYIVKCNSADAVCAASTCITATKLQLQNFLQENISEDL